MSNILQTWPNGCIIESMADLFSKFFPTPKFLKMPAIGFDISDESIHFVELVPRGGGYVLGRFGEKKISLGVMDAGKIKDTEGLKSIISSLRREYDLSMANVSLPEEQAYLVRMTLPYVRKKELRGSIELQLEEYIPLKAEEAVFDYEIISENEKEYDLEVSALPKAVAQSYFGLFSGTGLTPLVFEIEAQAIARAVLPQGDASAHMVIDFGETRTGLSVVSDGVVMFTSTLDIGGRTLNSAIEKTFRVSREEAERMKKEYGLVKKAADKEFFFTLMHPISILKDELNKHFIYWHTHKEPGEKERKRIESIVLCGGDSNLLGFSDYLAANLKVPVKVANVWVNINSFDNYVPEILQKDSLRYATALGLALGGIYEHD